MPCQRRRRSSWRFQPATYAFSTSGDSRPPGCLGRGLDFRRARRDVLLFRISTINTPLYQHHSPRCSVDSGVKTDYPLSGRGHRGSRVPLAGLGILDSLHDRETNIQGGRRGAATNNAGTSRTTSRGHVDGRTSQAGKVRDSTAPSHHSSAACIGRRDPRPPLLSAAKEDPWGLCKGMEGEEGQREKERVKKRVRGADGFNSWIDESENWTAICPSAHSRQLHCPHACSHSLLFSSSSPLLCRGVQDHGWARKL